MTGEQKRKDAVVVLGMHRSGTSAMARVLSLVGAELPSAISGPYFGNPLGHWEPKDVADFNDRILGNLDSDWSDPFGPLKLRQRKLPLKRYYSDAETIVKNNYKSSFIVFKEPRSIILWDLWKNALASEGYTICYIVMVRHPIEVADSLAERDKFLRQKSLILWSTYMAASEKDSRGKKRIFVKFDDLLQDAEAALDRIETSLNIEFPKRNRESGLEIERFLGRENKHHWGGDQSNELQKFPLIEAFYSYLDAKTRDEARNSEAPRNIEDWLNGLEISVGPLFKHYERQIEQRDAELAAEREAAGLARHERDEARARLAELQAEFERQVGQRDAELAAAREAAGLARNAHDEAQGGPADGQGERYSAVGSTRHVRFS